MTTADDERAGIGETAPHAVEAGELAVVHLEAHVVCAHERAGLYVRGVVAVAASDLVGEDAVKAWAEQLERPGRFGIGAAATDGEYA
jgi:hypothetical protein